MSKTIAGDTSTEIVKPATRPFHIVKIEFGTGNAFLSEGKQIVFNSDTYLDGRIDIKNMSWNERGIQKCQLDLFEGFSLALSNQIADTPVTIWQTYCTGGSTFTTPKQLISGILSPDKITPEIVTLDVLSGASESSFYPFERVTAENNFNFIMRPGQILEWGGEKYEMVNK